MRWIGWIRVRDAERDLCGVEHLRYAQGYGLTATENGTAGRGRYSRDWIVTFFAIQPPAEPHPGLPNGAVDDEVEDGDRSPRLQRPLCASFDVLEAGDMVEGCSIGFRFGFAGSNQ